MADTCARTTAPPSRFFVPPDLIGPLIGSLIDHDEEVVDEPTAAASDEIRSDVIPETHCRSCCAPSWPALS
jgi:hypothetical protein